MQFNQRGNLCPRVWGGCLISCKVEGRTSGRTRALGTERLCVALNSACLCFSRGLSVAVCEMGANPYN